jgi:hypothetical protein
MNITKESPVSPGDRWILGPEHSFDPRKGRPGGPGIASNPRSPGTASAVGAAALTVNRRRR